MFQSPCGDYVGGNASFSSLAIILNLCFSPLAGIMLAETWRDRRIVFYLNWSFSPLAGIMLAETPLTTPQRRFPRVSVPLRGLCWRKPKINGIGLDSLEMFQSPCGDYVGGNLDTIEKALSTEMFQSPCGDYVGGNF